jgi:hypothetical protein
LTASQWNCAVRTCAGTLRRHLSETAITAAGFLRRAIAFYRAHRITAQRVMTDSGSAYHSTVRTLACAALGIRH